uniref:Nuclear prelamin A recognition factor-like n=1 Tax=Eptatretus burgeri TaxID=7764 RepID=A0A8C4N9B5_EPTBU
MVAITNFPPEESARTKSFSRLHEECIKPVKVEKMSAKAELKISIDDDGNYVEIDESGSSRQLEKAQITLNDCLACSGCVTSAESMLIAQQSHIVLRHALENASLPHELDDLSKKIVIVSISPQSRASLAAKYGLSLYDAARTLTSFFKTLGARFVFDTTFAREFSLLESQCEFVERYQRHQQDVGALPMLASACPGWICYAEKTHGKFILPYISTVQSPQQVMGQLVKSHLSKTFAISPSNIFHATIMPCFDKKLEASRQDFYRQGDETRDVDCVITSGEVMQMLSEHGLTLKDCLPHPLDSLYSTEAKDGKLIGHAGGGSGGYLEHVFRYAARELFGKNVDTVTYKTLRNKDHREVTLEMDGKVVLRFAAAYGFRNIQNLMQKIKRGKSPYHYIEVMACPSGCLNGGGQIKPEDYEVPAELLHRVEELYESAPHQELGTLPEVSHIYQEWLGGSPGSVHARSILHTQYHALEKSTSALNLKW